MSNTNILKDYADITVCEYTAESFGANNAEQYKDINTYSTATSAILHNAVPIFTTSCGSLYILI